jgi:D-arabinose 1-dehydrogenase-like Zn-dependent alcohol dehydrogenase
VERSSLAAVWRESAARWLEPHKVEAAGPIARSLASGVFYSNVHAARGDFRLRRRPLILSYESLGFVSSLSSVSTLVTDGDISGASRRAVDRTGIKSVHAPLAREEETL